ncbi:hypothetical protein BX600DRAFT_500405 [Xylariales sp. PMI_506]|nr:hypothetical protein BX600DRAFT_500405 [Xylariales sp. PMI_506]
MAYARNWVELYKAKHSGNRELTLKLTQKLTTGYVGCTDFPHICITPELLELYPEAKVVLVTRDPNECWGSFSLILQYSDALFVPYLSRIAPSLRWWPALVSAWKKETDILLRETGSIEGQYGPNNIVLGVVEAHNRRIMELVPQERLLVIDIKQGWEPLCAFLGKPVPEEPFPLENDTQSATKVAGLAYIKLSAMWIAASLFLVVPLYCGFRVWDK